jgi:endonuclease/exonuclease/phosphatase family metal-dependent hydrolase
MEEVLGSGVVRVATLNLWGRSGAWEERRSVLIDGFRQLQPNIVALQEVVKTDGYDQASDVLGSEFRIAHHGGRSEDGTGAAIASRWPLGELLEADLPVTPRVDPANGWIGRVAAAEILAPDPVGPLLFVHHKPSWQRGFERELQAVAATRFVEELLGESGTHVVLAGDFDAIPDSASVRFWSGRQSLDGTSVCYRDAWESVYPGEPGHTFTPVNPLVARCRSSWAAGSTTSWCAATITVPRLMSPPASASSTNPWMVCGRATTSASSRTSRLVHSVDDRSSDHCSSLLPLFTGLRGRLILRRCVLGEGVRGTHDVHKNNRSA